MKGFTISLGFCLLSLVSHFTPISGYGTGAPTVACGNLTPQHDKPAQTTPSPFKITLNKGQLPVHTPLSITLTSKNGRDEFKGFLVQVRMVGDPTNKPFGDFEDDSISKNKDSRVLPCSGTNYLAVTHKDAKPKKKVTVKWIPKEPGRYRIHTTFVKEWDTFWVNQMTEEEIEVLPHADHDNHDQRPHSNAADMDHLCSTMKLNASVEPVQGSSNPYMLTVEPVEKMSAGGDSHKIGQKEMMLINVTSELGTPIYKLFMVVRRQESRDAQAFGKFIADSSNDIELVNCFGGKANGLLFMNRMHKRQQIADLSLKWQAPQDETGDFEILATVLSQEDTFWDRIGEDPEASKIKVVKKQSKQSNGKSSSSVSGGSFSVIGRDSMVFKALQLSIFFMFAIFVAF